MNSASANKNHAANHGAPHDSGCRFAAAITAVTAITAPAVKRLADQVCLLAMDHPERMGQLAN